MVSEALLTFQRVPFQRYKQPWNTVSPWRASSVAPESLGYPYGENGCRAKGS